MNMRQGRKRVLLAAVLVAMIGAACGDDSDSGTSDNTTAAAVPTAGTATTTAPSDVDPSGVLKIGLDLTGTGAAVFFDPIKLPSPLTPEHYLIYDTLLRSQVDGTFKPGLAKSATIADPTTINLELNPGIKFSDGTNLDAEAVKYSIERNIASKNTGAFAVEMQQTDTITVNSPTTLTIKLKTPIAGVYYTLLGRGETSPVSPTAAKAADAADPKAGMGTKPVGAGPFTLESSVVESKVRFVKNPTYFQADQVKVSAIEYIHVTAANQVTAMKAGTVDAIDNLQIATASQITGPGLTVFQQQSDNVLLWAQICKRDAPLSDVKVRQALNFGLDRDAINNVMYGGKSEPQWGFFGTKSPLYDATLKDYFKRDVAKAKQLLTEAGFPNGLKLNFMITAGDSQKVSELIQAQWKEIGVDLQLTLTQNVLTDFFIPNPKGAGMFFPLQRSGLDKVTRNLVPGSIGNICNWDDPDLNALVDKIRAVQPTSAEAKTLWSQLQKLALERAMNIFGVYGVTSNAYTDKVGNATFIANFQGIPYLDVLHAYKKK
ncbi:MAG: ABC transporter substrate-binding protein [Acidimicrobiia bacterium]